MFVFVCDNDVVVMLSYAFILILLSSVVDCDSISIEMIAIDYSPKNHSNLIIVFDKSCLSLSNEFFCFCFDLI